MRRPSPKSTLLAAALALLLLSGELPSTHDAAAGRMPSAVRPDSPLQSQADGIAIFLPRVTRRDAESRKISARVGGGSRALVARGDHVYVAIDDRLVAFDVSTAANFGPVGQSQPIAAPIEALALAGDLLYAAAGEAGVVTFDLTEPETPQFRHGLGLGGSAGDLLVHQDRLYVALAGDENALATLDLSQPQRPASIHRLSAGGSARRMARSGDLLYLSHCGFDLAVVSLETTEAPALVKLSGSADEDCSTLGPDSRLGDLALVGNFLAPTITSEASGSQIVWSLDDPRDPEIDDGPWIRGGRLGQLAQLDGHAYMAIGGSSAADPGLDGLWVGSVPGPLGEPYGAIEGAHRQVPSGLVALTIDAEGSRLYAGGDRANLVAYDISNPANPIETARYLNAAGAGRIAAGSDQIYTVEDAPAALGIVSTAGPWPARRMGSFPLVAEAITPEQVTLLADPKRRYAYMLYYNSMQVVEASAPDQPAARRLLAMPDITTMAIDDRWIYAAGDGLRIIDVFNQDDPQTLAYARQAGTALAVASEGQRVYTAQKEPTRGRPTTLNVWDVSDRDNPRNVAKLGDIGPTVGMAALGGFVWHAFDYSQSPGEQAKGAALVTVDARDPNGVREVAGARIPLAGLPRRLVRDASRERIYLLEHSWFDRRTRRWLGRDGVHVIDISQPDRPRIVDFVATAPPARDIDARDGQLYIADDTGVTVVSLLP